MTAVGGLYQLSGDLRCLNISWGSKALVYITGNRLELRSPLSINEEERTRDRERLRNIRSNMVTSRVPIDSCHHWV